MSDYYNNDNNNTNNSNSDGEYSYSKSQINQGESYYQWTPYEEGKKPKKVKKVGGFGKKLGKVAAIALVFGLVAGIAFQSVVYVSDNVLGLNKTSSETADTGSDSTGDTAKSTDSDGAVATTTSKISTDVSEVAASVMPAIVQVTNVSLTQYQTFFGQTYSQENTSAGSGIIINQDDDNIYIASNNHVVEDAETLTITFSDGTAVEGSIKGTDSSCDLAVISVPISDIPEDTLSQIKVATMGDSDAATVGESCIVIGNAMGYGQSVTLGIISAKDREVSIEDDNGNVVTNDLIQTDAAVNPGNSGGALLNMSGEVIGIVSAKLSSSSVEGMGYAIPISYASSIINQMVDNDVVSDLDASYLGIAGKDVTSSMAEQYSIPAGVYVAQVVSGSAAEEAGIRVGDVITSFNGRKVTSMSTIQNIMQYLKAGTEVDITVAQQANNYEETTVTATLSHKYDDVQ